jgi:hypothetical protein
MRFDYHAINEGVNGCLRLMNACDMINFEVPDNKSVTINKTTWVRANSSGLFHMSVNNGAPVSKGDLLGIIFNPFGETEEKILSQVNGYIVGINNRPVVDQGDALIHIGMTEE